MVIAQAVVDSQSVSVVSTLKCLNYARQIQHLSPLLVLISHHHHHDRDAHDDAASIHFDGA